MTPIVYGVGAAVAGLTLFATSDQAQAAYSSEPAKEYPPVDYSQTGPDNLAAFLKVIRIGESNDDYQALYGGGRFESFAQHPAIKTPSNPNPFQGADNSHAAGAYQFQPGTWQDAARANGLADFSPSNQDLAAVWAIKRRGAYSDIVNGYIEAAMFKLRDEWTSLAIRGQQWVLSMYSVAGGNLA